jgi:CrcB protein
MGQLIAIATGGALGAVMRFVVSNWFYTLMGRDFPYGTLAVNVLGSFVMGIGYVLMVERIGISPEWRAVILVGFLGAFTTFSTFSIETLNLIESGELIKAAMNALLSVLLCLIAVWAGVILGRQL